MPRSSIRFVSLILAAFACAIASPFAIAHEPEADDATFRATLKAQADQWDRDIVAKKRDAIAANLAPDFREINGAGKLVARDAFIATLMDPALRMDPYTVQDFAIRRIGDVALVTGRIVITGTLAGKPFTDDFRYTDTYARRDGKWQVVQIQITPVAGD